MQVAVGVLVYHGGGNDRPTVAANTAINGVGGVEQTVAIGIGRAVRPAVIVRVQRAVAKGDDVIRGVVVGI